MSCPEILIIIVRRVEHKLIRGPNKESRYLRLNRKIEQYTDLLIGS